jgi:Arc/MetJ-type ribon-helix-helix transcriptional regulator
MRDTITISLPAGLRRDVVRQARAQRLTRSEYVRKALLEKLWEDAVDQSVRRLAPRARAMGLHADEDVFGRVS